MNKFTFLLPLMIVFIFSSCSDQKDDDDNKIVSTTLKACSFNIRFDNPADGINKWENRRKSVVSFIAVENPDIIGFQEVLVNQLNYMETRLIDYARVGIGRDDGEAAGEFAPVFYNKDRFELADSGNFWLSETPGEPSLGWDALIKRICTWVFLEDKHSGERIHVYNTHFSHVGSQARLKSAELIMDSITDRSSGARVILTGDFNTEPNSDPYLEIISGGLEDSYNSEIKLGPVGTYNGFRLLGPHDRRIDYIFIKGFNSEYYVCNSMVINNNYLSDHFPVITMLEYR